MRTRLLFALTQALVIGLLPLSVLAQEPDPYEPDDPGLGEAPWIGLGETQSRSFYPAGDVDTARLRVKAGHWYEVTTRNLAPLVDTVLTVDVAGVIYHDDDSGDEPLASRLTFQAAETTDALLTVVTSQGVYSTTQTYQLYAAELPAPTAMPTLTPLPTSTPKPTRQPAPTATPARPIVAFSASADRVDQAGQCVTLHWHVERATEVYLIQPNGNREGVVGDDERQVCPLETSTYALQVFAPGGDERVEVTVNVPLPTPTPTVAPASSGSTGSGMPKGKATVHAAVFVDENGSAAYDPQEGVLGAMVTLLSQSDPGQRWTATTDELGQAHVADLVPGSYTLLVPHLGFAATVTLRGEAVTVPVLVEPLQLPARIP